MSETLDLSMFVTRDADGLARMELAVDGVACAGCIRKIEEGLKAMPGIASARLNFTDRRLVVGWREDKIGPGDVIYALERIGYRSHPFRPQQAESDEAQHARWLFKCLAVAGFAAMNVMLLSVSVWSGNVTDMTGETRDLFHWLSAAIALPAAAYAGQPFFLSAFRALRLGRTNMDVPISIGVVLALGMSLAETIAHAEHAYFDSALMLLFFLLCGRALDHAMRRKTRAVAGNLAALKAEVAHRLDDNNEIVSVPSAALRPGDRVLVRAGERVPADGVILTGSTELDESLVTGETARRVTASGAEIYAGSRSYSGAITMKVTAAAGGSLIDEVQRLLDSAILAKSKIVRLADRAARLYAPVVHLTAALTVIGWLIAGASIHDAIVTGIAVLIITCPCALALAIPAVQVVASGALFRSRIIVNAGDAIERLARADTVVFDKTGTLTLPDAQLVDAAAIPPDLLERAARLALSSHHPLAAAVAQHAQRRTPYDGAVEEAGCGVRAVIDGVEARLGSPEFCGVAAPMDGTGGLSFIGFMHNGRSTVLSVRQALRPAALETVRALAALGLDLHILSGDRVEAVAPVAEALGIRSWRAGLKPAEKIACLAEMKAAGRRVLMVGDGLNDAPALAAAHVSLSPISAAEITQAQADAVFLGEPLLPVLDAVRIARQARALMMQNLWIAVLYNAIAVPVAIAGGITPLIAAAAMSGSSIIVTLNAFRARGKAARRDALPVPAGAPATGGAA
ncbi:heavy metal translocating P-type ATPase [Rhodoplanes sp. Z2-YC6860]|uniref:heavy metal translocating P-type ATPase n=1 Tax=Rhodoplanes sp. Z2-YC6860 TaxID=674703 RepID=UPI00078BF1F7|nr:heavy metal translocating P-type ATPase [Rhodoplanes sp. Z2-YC6860]AMN44999.1 heavy metal translocating P-type ATPase [Rhodoplanes sp. Z2-YC6860]